LEMEIQRIRSSDRFMRPTMTTGCTDRKFLLPPEINGGKQRMVHLVLEEAPGTFGVFPSRFECVAELVPGMLLFETDTVDEVYAGVDEKMFCKSGQLSFLTLRKALLGSSPEGSALMPLGPKARFVLSVMERLDAAFLLRFAIYQYESYLFGAIRGQGSSSLEVLYWGEDNGNASLDRDRKGSFCG